MPASTIANRESGASARAKLNANAALIDSNTTALGTKQPLDADLTAIAGLTATTNNFIVSVASAWASRTPTQVKVTLSLDNVDNTSDLNKPVSTATTTALALKQDANAVSTLKYNINVAADAAYTASTSDVNRIVQMTNTAARVLNITTGTAFVAGQIFYFYNHTGSTNNVTVTAGGGVTYTGATTILPGQTALFSCISANVYTRHSEFILSGAISQLQGLSPSADDTLQYIGGAWTNRTVAQVKTTLSLNNVDNTSDATKNAAAVALTNKTGLNTHTIPGGTSTLALITDVALKQTANSDSTLNDIYTAVTNNVTVGIADNNYFYHGTIATGKNFTINAGLASIPVGGTIYLYNDLTSGANYTVNGTATYTGSTAVVPGATAIIKKIDTNSYHRIV